MIDFLFSKKSLVHSLVGIVVELVHSLVDSMVYLRIVGVVGKSLEIGSLVGLCIR